MAVRDRNLSVWQAYVITMSIVSVVLLVGLFFAWRAWSDASTRLADAEKKLADQGSLYREETGKVELMQAMIGVGPYSTAEITDRLGNFENDATMKPLIDQYQQAMTAFGSNVQETDKNLLKLPSYLLETIRARNSDFEANRAKTRQLEADLKATVDRETAARQAAETALAQAKKDLETAQIDHKQQLAAVNKERDKTVALFDTYKRELDAKLAQEVAKSQTLATDNNRLLAAVEKLQSDLDEYQKPDFASPQGRVVRVSNGSTKVWINLGSDDGLRVGVPFSVLDESAVNISSASPKAKIVVTRVVGPHLAQCDTVELDYANIIVSEDLVYSPAWRAGRKVGFALVGEMDLNGDNKDDLNQVRQLISLGGGVVDAEKPASGNESGKFDYNTTWLVLGTDLTLPENASEAQRADNAARMAAYKDFINKARQYGVQEISLDKLMGYLKTKSSDRTVPLGSRGQAKDFVPRDRNRAPTSNGDVSEIFRPRSPIK